MDFSPSISPPPSLYSCLAAFPVLHSVFKLSWEKHLFVVLAWLWLFLCDGATSRPDGSASCFCWSTATHSFSACDVSLRFAPPCCWFTRPAGFDSNAHAVVVAMQLPREIKQSEAAAVPLPASRLPPGFKPQLANQEISNRERNQPTTEP